MEMHKKFIFEKFETYLALISKRIVLTSVKPESLEVRDPSFEHFDCPEDSGDWKSIQRGQHWGSKQNWTDFRASFTVPLDWNEGSIDFCMEHNCIYTEPFICSELEAAGPEGQVFIDSQRVGAIDREHHKIRHKFITGTRYDVRAVFFAGRTACDHILQKFCLKQIDVGTEKLYYDIKILIDIAKLLEKTSRTYYDIIHILEDTIRQLDMRDIPEMTLSNGHQRCLEDKVFYKSVAKAQEIYDHGLTKLQGTPDVPFVSVVGHSHIDLAWLWPIRQTHHKCVRTFATQCRLLNQYDTWVYNQSSPQIYKWLEFDAPDLLEKVRGFISDGRWEAEGAMWCEADTNVPNGESLVRQLLYGKRYFKNKLGVDSRILWLPDVFGYSGALPQLLKLANVDGFVTSKISWSQYNRFPYDTFMWRGIDGTGIPTHFITTPCKGTWILTYNAMMQVDEVKGTWDEYRQKSLGIEPLISYGHGDGGGGPTEEMIENSLRMSELPPIESFPKLRHEKVLTLMKRVCQKASNMPSWDGELYLEYHRGTYTSQAWLKRDNRKNEIRLHNIEWLASIAADLYTLDKPAIDTIWEDLMLCQFHDILPGSSVSEVYYDEVRPMQQAMALKLENMIKEATDAIAAELDTSSCVKPLVLFNTLSWDRSDPIKLPDGTWVDGVIIPSGGWIVIDAAQETKLSDREISISPDGTKMSNHYWNIEFNKKGHICTLTDKKNNREVLSSGYDANQWQVFEDRPMAHPAWDIDLYYRDHPLEGPSLISRKVVENSPVRVAIEQVWHMPSIGGDKTSTITQRIAIYDKNPRIDFETTVDWYEHHQLLKVAFPVNIHSTEATFQIQFGHLKRPTHTNTSWDLAKFEVCAHQYMDLGEHGYGVALMNDCKYGHDVDRNTIRLTCIKCAQSPDPLADQGYHEFIYSLLPHHDSFQAAGIERAAYELNTPVIACQTTPSTGQLPPSFAFAQCDSDAIVISTIKPAEDDDATIVRLYESYGSQVSASITFTKDISNVEVVNLLEESIVNDIDMVKEENKLLLKLMPFQIVTLKIS